MQQRMSALGHKRTCAVQTAMSALHPIADMCAAMWDVRFVPIADSENAISILIGARLRFPLSAPAEQTV